MSQSLVRFLRLFVLVILLVTAVSTHAQSDNPEALPAPESVAIAGTFQTALGCPGNWNTDCAETALTYDPDDDLWTAVFDLAAGSYEYKAALNGTWEDNYGLYAEYYGANIPLEVTEDGPVTFWYDHKTRWVSDSVNSLLANVAGDFQDEIGCPGDWQPDCLRSLLQDPEGDGRYQFITIAIPPGVYEAKVAVNQSWDVNYGAEGLQDGPNIPFTVPENAAGVDVAVIFTFSPVSHLLEIDMGDPALVAGQISGGPAGGTGGAMPPPAARMPETVTIPGTIQSVLGCSGDWMPDCAITYLNWDEAAQVWSATFTIPAGDYEYKAALNDSWDENFGLNAESYGPNIPLSLSEETAVTFYFDHNTGWVTDDVNSLIAGVVGSFQDELGCAADWQANCLKWLQDPDDDGVLIFRTLGIPAGDYEAKVAINQSMDINYGTNGTLDGANIPFNIPADDTLVTFIFDSTNHALSIRLGEAGPVGNLKELKAYWVTADTLAWNIDTETADTFALHYNPDGAPLRLGEKGVEATERIPLTLDPAGLSADILAKFPHLKNYAAFKIKESDLSRARIALKGQVAISAANIEGVLDVTGLQMAGMLDDVFPYDGPLGVTYEDDGAGGIAPTLRVWAPTARSVKLHLFADAATEQAEITPMRIDSKTGVWSITGTADWNRQFYLYEVEVFVPSEGSVVKNLVTDPYSFSLSANSKRSQIVNLADADLLPTGWETLAKPTLNSLSDSVIYELHIRDFSITDETVSEANRGKYLAFTETESDGMQHLAALAQSGVTHLHLLPAFDFATVEEIAAGRTEVNFADLADFPPDSEEQQALVNEIRTEDGFNWGYDPVHYTVPEGSYASDPNGVARIIEFRQMVQSLNKTGLRVVMDVVYNHTTAAGQRDNSVLDRIVPGYYHRLDDVGKVERSTCCANTATENDMMRKLMIDSVLTWAKLYKVDGFRFDLMGHHMKADMLAVRAALDSLTLENDGVDGNQILIYGEGWNFGEVANNARGVNATQMNMAGTGIGTFNDRVRDAVRGGSPFGGYQEQGFATGLYTDPNETDQGSEAEQLARLLLFSDQIRVALAGNLADYEFMDRNGQIVSGKEVDYNGSPTGYGLTPLDQIVYISAHDNETLFDAIQYKAPLAATTADRARMQEMGLSLVALSQGIPFFHAGSDMLRSKSMDRDSYDSGDWFNELDFSYASNNWGAGLPPKEKNGENWPIIQPLLAAEGITPSPDDILHTASHFQEMIQIRQSSPLFRLETAVSIQDRLTFYNTGPEQIPGLIVMSLSDRVGEDLDPERDMIVVLFNSTPVEQSFAIPELAGEAFTLHSVQLESHDPVVREARFDMSSGTFVVPARTTAVFELPQTIDMAAPAVITRVVEATAVPEPATAEPETRETVSANEGGSPWVAIGGGLVAVGAGAGLALARRRKS
ncbi:MAG: pullulanase-type alpha-1,6-glucosidase [Ardenticatenaceae bacterium]|nr:pullulanase-type alpha-1,6-glucosidase [Ardenticatenaceae bacterium]MCB9443047.1 pullulanase-type alpha-1,6-glucosidase [Ardenticatenaceae bacterium]